MFARRLGKPPLITAWILWLRRTKSPMIPSASLPAGNRWVLCFPISIASAWWLDDVSANARTTTTTAHAIRMDWGIRRLKWLIRLLDMSSFLNIAIRSYGCSIFPCLCPCPCPCPTSFLSRIRVLGQPRAGARAKARDEVWAEQIHRVPTIAPGRLATVP